MSESLKLEKKRNDLPGGWKRIALGEACTLGGGTTPRKSEEKYWGGDVAWASPKDFNGVSLADTEDKLTDYGVSDNSINFYDAGNIVMVVRSGVLRHSLPVAQLSAKMAVNQDIKVLQPDTARITEDYLLNILLYESDRVRASCAKTGTTVESIETAFLEAYKIPLPPLTEQHRIANILSTVDEQIQQTDEVIEETLELRAGLLEGLYHQGYRKHDEFLSPGDLAEKSGGVNTGLDQTTVGSIPSTWDTERLGDLAESSSYGLNASAEEFDESKLRYLRITDIADDGHLKDDDPTSISHEKATEYELEPGDLVFARTGATVGKTCLYRDDHPDAAYAGYLIRFKLDDSRVLPEFVFYYTQTDNYDRWVTRITRQGAQENINSGEYSSILLPLPPIDEQQQIVNTLQTVDVKIDDERQTKQKLQELKRGLMQDLLTGNVRVSLDGDN